jgi:hypothetical protein
VNRATRGRGDLALLEKYTKMFSNLRTDKSRNRYPAITKHLAPHKPFVLLSVMDLIGQGQITTSFIAPTFDLLDTFNGYWSAVTSAGAKTSIAYPFSGFRITSIGSGEILSENDSLSRFDPHALH